MKPAVWSPPAKQLYDQDFFEWTVRNADLLCSGRLDEADLEHIAEEIEDMGKSERRELESRLEVLLAHLLKWSCQPARRGRSWKATIRVQRTELLRWLADMPSLRNHLRRSLAALYPVGIERAISEADLPDDAFPKTCPFTFDQILDPDFFPE